MQVRAGGATFHPYQPDDIATLRDTSCYCLQRALMNVHREHAMAVIQHRGAAGEIEIWLRKNDGSIRWRVNRRAFGGRDVDAEVRRGEDAVQDTLAAEQTADDSRHRPVERICKGDARCVA